MVGMVPTFWVKGKVVRVWLMREVVFTVSVVNSTRVVLEVTLELVALLTQND